MTALAPSSEACSIIRSKASARVCSQSFVNSEMLPPTIVCNPAPIVPNSERERTTIPRTTPRFCLIRYPGSSNAVVTFSCGTMHFSFAPVDQDDRLVFFTDHLFEAIVEAELRSARNQIGRAHV